MHFFNQKHCNHHQAEYGNPDIGICHIAELNERKLVGCYNSCTFQSYQRNKQSDTDRNRIFQCHGNIVHDNFPDIEDGQQHKTETRKQNTCQGKLPGMSHCNHHAEGEEIV